MRRLALLLAAVLTLSGCGGGGGSAQDALSDTASNLGKIRSGDLTLELLFMAKGGEEQGFRLQGPVALGQGSLPVADLEYTQIAGSQEATTRFISTGNKAFVEVEGTAYELPPGLVADLQSATVELRSEGGLEQIEIGRWFEDPELSEGGDLGGDETDLVRARLNVVEVVNGLLGIAAEFGGTKRAPRVEGRGAEQLENAVRSARLELWTGKDDRLLRRLRLAIDLGVKAPAQVKSLVGAGVRFELSVLHPNEEVQVSEPEGARPSSELFGGE
jgi:hypothetical protein